MNAHKLLIRVLETVTYPPKNDASWQNDKLRDPDWEAIEKAILRLDRNGFPYLWLYVDEPVEFEEPSHAMNILGGRGEYAISAYVPNGLLYYIDDNRSHNTVQIWESDQGSIQREKDLCNDLQVLFDLVEYFCRTGELHPKANWRS